MKKVSLNDIGDDIDAKKRNGSTDSTNVLCLTWTIYFLFIMIKNVDISILSADYILVDFAFWHTFDIFCFENIVYSI